MRMTASHVFFWYGPFSNWHKPSYFSGQAAIAELRPMLDDLGVTYPGADEPITVVLSEHRYHCGEQWMMAVKAWLFGDSLRLVAIQGEWEPKVQKAIGRDVAPFDGALWDRVSVHVVAAGTIARLEANPGLLAQFLATGDRVFVEGSPYDRVWGVGVRWDDPRIEDPRNWRGKNKLGVSHGIARAILAGRRAPARAGWSRSAYTR